MKAYDKVELRTGGPVMIINEVLTTIKDIGKGRGKIRCKWWDQTEKRFKEYYFMEGELVLYKQGPRAIVK